MLALKLLIGQDGILQDWGGNILSGLCLRFGRSIISYVIPNNFSVFKYA